MRVRGLHRKHGDPAKAARSTAPSVSPNWTARSSEMLDGMMSMPAPNDSSRQEHRAERRFLRHGRLRVTIGPLDGEAERDVHADADGEQIVDEADATTTTFVPGLRDDGRLLPDALDG